MASKSSSSAKMSARPPFSSPKPAIGRRKKGSKRARSKHDEEVSHHLADSQSKNTKDDTNGRVNDADLDAIILTVLRSISLNSPDDCLRVGAYLRKRGMYKHCRQFYTQLRKYVSILDNGEQLNKRWKPECKQALEYNISIAEAHIRHCGIETDEP